MCRSLSPSAKPDIMSNLQTINTLKHMGKFAVFVGVCYLVVNATEVMRERERRSSSSSQCHLIDISISFIRIDVVELGQTLISPSPSFQRKGHWLISKLRYREWLCCCKTIRRHFRSLVSVFVIVISSSWDEGIWTLISSQCHLNVTSMSTLLNLISLSSPFLLILISNSLASQSSQRLDSFNPPQSLQIWSKLLSKFWWRIWTYLSYLNASQKWKVSYTLIVSDNDWHWVSRTGVGKRSWSFLFVNGGDQTETKNGNGVIPQNVDVEMKHFGRFSIVCELPRTAKKLFEEKDEERAPFGIPLKELLHGGDSMINGGSFSCHWKDKREANTLILL